jgi:hypothetical protein
MAMTMAMPMLLTRAIWIAICFVSLSTARLLTQAGHEVKLKTGKHRLREAAFLTDERSFALHQFPQQR